MRPPKASGGRPLCPKDLVDIEYGIDWINPLDIHQFWDTYQVTSFHCVYAPEWYVQHTCVTWPATGAERTSPLSSCRPAGHRALTAQISHHFVVSVAKKVGAFNAPPPANDGLTLAPGDLHPSDDQILVRCLLRLTAPPRPCRSGAGGVRWSAVLGGGAKWKLHRRTEVCTTGAGTVATLPPSKRNCISRILPMARQPLGAEFSSAATTDVRFMPAPTGVDSRGAGGQP